MVLYRYIAREVLITMLSVAAVVLIISMGWRFSGYLNSAASGLLSRDVLFLIMAYRLPGFLELIIPISFFLGVMLAYGRMYVDSEMVVLEGCGVGPWRMVSITMVLALIVMVITAAVSLWLKPAGEREVESLFRNQQKLTEFDTLAPGRFQMIRSGRRVTYTEELSDSGTLREVFMNEYNEAAASGARDMTTVIAESGETQVDALGNRFLVLKNGTRYSGRPGEAGYQIIDYEEYGQLIEKEPARYPSTRVTATPTVQLLDGLADPQLAGELQWRVSVVLMIPVIALLALPLSRVNPRQGRFTKLIPGMLLCFVYVGMLSSAKSSLQQGNLPLSMGILWVHVVFLGIAWFLYFMLGRRR